MSHQLFAELTLEQQEIVSGGKTIDKIWTNYKEVWEYLDFNVYSTKEGSFVNQKFVAQQIDTSAKKFFKFEPDFLKSEDASKAY
ncbi:MAG TPA: CTB family bacteriocin [Nostocaceae cyanobacterium]|nr:CTB family bacteriocin [Nostocaceae cyanobacterium]